MCKDILDFSEGKKSVRANGLLDFAISRDQFEPHVFYVWERYDSNASLGRHNSCTEYQAFMENVRAAASSNAHALRERSAPCVHRHACMHHYVR